MDSLKDNSITMASLERIRVFLKNRCFGVIPGERSSEIESEIRRAGFGFLLIKDLAEPDECKGYLVIGSVGRIESQLISFLARYHQESTYKIEDLLPNYKSVFYTRVGFFSRQENLF